MQAKPVKHIAMKPPSFILEVKESRAATLSRTEITLKGGKNSQLIFMQCLSKAQQVNIYQKNVKTEVTDFVIMNNFVMPNRELICQQFGLNILKKYVFPHNKKKVTK